MLGKILAIATKCGARGLKFLMLYKEKLIRLTSCGVSFKVILEFIKCNM